MKAKVRKKKPWVMPTYPKIAEAAKRRNHSGTSRIYYKDPKNVPGYQPQPDFRPITGHGTDQPLPKVQKVPVEYRYVKRPKLWIPSNYRKKEVRAHKYTLMIPEKEWHDLAYAARALMMPASFIIRLGIRRFMRAFKKNELFTTDGRHAGRVMTRRLFTRAEQEILNSTIYQGAYVFKAKEEEHKWIRERQRQKLLDELENLQPPKEKKRPIPEPFRPHVKAAAERKHLRKKLQQQAEESAARLEQAQQEIQEQPKRRMFITPRGV